jgi:hypothetical protein
VTRHGAALPPAFSLLKSEYNDFLFASVGTDDDDRGTLTVLSAFSREGLDPWQQAAKLRQLPRELATRNLASILAGLPDGVRSASEAQLAADRLIELLPRRMSPTTRVASVAQRVRSVFARLASRVSR